MGLLRMVCLVTCPLIKVNHFKQSVFITPELSSNAGFIAHDSAMALSALFSVFLLFYPHLQPYHRTKLVYPLPVSTSI